MDKKARVHQKDMRVVNKGDRQMDKDVTLSSSADAMPSNHLRHSLTRPASPSLNLGSLFMRLPLLLYLRYKTPAL